jgi:hypothetical protein
MAEALEKKAPLEDLMAAMDVVDTLRHERGIATRELDNEGRRERLLKRLREMYEAQGIDVSDRVLQEGIDALEQERFQYHPVESSWKTKLAHIWVSRGRWKKPVGIMAVIASLFGGGYIVTDVLPERQQQAEQAEMIKTMPVRLSASLGTIKRIAKDPAIVADAEKKSKLAKQAIADKKYSRAQSLYANVKNMASQLQQEYSIRVVSRQGVRSGVWRVPDVNRSGKNYYLVVEAIDAENNVIALDVLSEESNKRKKVKTWGLRVNQRTFERIAADKRDDGIIQDNKVGRKSVGYLAPEFSIATTGATITEW